MKMMKKHDRKQEPPAEVMSFIVRYIRSVEQLEVLLLLHRDKDTEWSAQALNNLLKSTLTSIQARLLDLAQNGFLKRRSLGTEILYRFDSPSSFDSVLWELQTWYQSHPAKIIERIYQA